MLKTMTHAYPTLDGKALVKILPAKMLIEARAEKQAISETKRLNQLAIAKAKLDRIMRGKLRPEEMFKQAGNDWKAWDERGIPLIDGEGIEISKAKRKKLVKEWEAQVKLSKEYDAWVAGGGGKE